MYPDWEWVLLGAPFIWLAILTFLVWQQRNFLKSLVPKSGERDLRKKFEEILREVESFNGDLGQLKSNLAETEKLGQFHIQKVELLRYNPYDDTGGDQSFSIALLDDHGTGVVITSLHARSTTRVFAKPVMAGKSSKYLFSKEEEQVIKKALG